MYINISFYLHEKAFRMYALLHYGSLQKDTQNSIFQFWMCLSTINHECMFQSKLYLNSYTYQVFIYRLFTLIRE